MEDLMSNQTGGFENGDTVPITPRYIAPFPRGPMYPERLLPKRVPISSEFTHYEYLLCRGNIKGSPELDDVYLADLDDYLLPALCTLDGVTSLEHRKTLVLAAMNSLSRLCWARQYPREAVSIRVITAIYVPADWDREITIRQELLDPGLLDPKPFNPGTPGKLPWQEIELIKS
jgi:hypothetical protein